MKTKLKKVKISLANNKDVADLFNQMLGTGATNLNIAYPRYQHMKSLSERIVAVFELFVNSDLMRIEQLKESHDDIVAFCKNARNYINAWFSFDLSAWALDFSAAPQNIREEFGAQYEAAKKSNIVRDLISIADKLHPYRSNFIDDHKLNHHFVADISGVDWSPFPFDLNLKQLFCMQLTPAMIELTMLVLCKTYHHSFALYENLRAPDIDIDQFIEIITSSLRELQRRPELNRCEKAFKKIHDSVQLLKTNFADYYRDFIDTKDNMIIMENFILDVSNNTKADPQLTSQFRKIIMYYKDLAKQSPNNQNNEKLNAVFEALSDKFKMMDQNFDNLGNSTRRGDDPANSTEESAGPDNEKSSNVKDINS